MLQPKLTLRDDFPPVTYEAWRALVQTEAAGAAFERKLVARTYDGIRVQPLYTRDHWDGAGDPSGLPGTAPFVRGSRAVEAGPRDWDVRQDHAHPELDLTNAAIRQDLDRGANSVQIRLDAAARTGTDPREPDAADRVGRNGVAACHVDDLDAVLAGVNLEDHAVALDAGAASLPAAAMLVALWERRDIDRATARGAFNADPLGTLAGDGRLCTSLPRALAQLADLAAWTAGNAPGVTAVGVQTGPYHWAGATAAQDLAFSMATGIEYLRSLTRAGIGVDTAARQTLFTYDVGCRFFLAIAKLRAARRLWCRVVQACGGSTDGQAMRMAVRPSRRILTKRDAWVNVLRNTVCCFAGSVGGADVIHTMPFDAALGLPGEFSRRLARNTPIILCEESYLGRVIDPAGGSAYLESLTDQLANTAWTILQEIEQRGGMATALTAGWVAEQVASVATARFRAIAHRKDAITGVSEFPNLHEKPVDIHHVDRARLAARVASGLSGRAPSDERVEALNRVAAHTAPPNGPPGRVMAAAIEAAGHGAWIAELVKAIAHADAPVEMAALEPRPLAKPFEDLRDASDAFMATHGQRPRVLLANLGPVAGHTARSTYARNLFEAGGFEVRSSEPLERPDQVAEAVAAGGAKIVVLCSSGPSQETLVTGMVAQLKAAGARTVVLAGRPGDHEAAYREAGVHRFIHVGCDVHGTLTALLKEEGVLR